MNTKGRAILFALALLVVEQVQAFPIQMGLAPDNNLSVLLSLLNSAQRSLLINIYQYDSAPVTEALLRKIRAGVTVRILIEGQPFGGMSAGGKRTIGTLSAAIQDSGNPDSRVFVMTKMSDAIKRRFRFNHAKYVIADGARALISSENFTSTGHVKEGGVGNRGWDIVVEETPVVSELAELFAADTDLGFSDVVDMTDYARMEAFSPMGSPVVPSRDRKIKARPLMTGDAESAALITSPRATEALTALISSAKERLDVEEASLPHTWYNKPSPLVTEIIRAAQRGVQVRVLLNDEGVFRAQPEEPADDDAAPAKKTGNGVTVKYLQAAARAENIPLLARIVDVKKLDITYIHNKGMIIDGRKVLISSINGTSNSVKNNREVAVLVDSSDAALYYGAAFGFDWEGSDPAPKAEEISVATLPFTMERLFLGVAL